MAVAGQRVLDLASSAKTLVGEGGGHSDVDDGYVGLVLGHVCEELFGVGRQSHYVEARLFQQTAEPLAQQDGVVGHHYSHESCTSRRVPPTSLAGQPDPAPERLDAVAQPSDTAASLRTGAPDAVVLDGEAVRTPSVTVVTISIREARECLAALVSVSLTTKYAAVST